MKPPQLEVGLVEIILWWNRSWNAQCTIPRFPLSRRPMPTPKRPALKRPCAQTAAPRRRRPNGGAQTSCSDNYY